MIELFSLSENQNKTYKLNLMMIIKKKFKQRANSHEIFSLTMPQYHSSTYQDKICL